MYFILVVVLTVHDKKIRGKIIFKNRGKNQNLKTELEPSETESSSVTQKQQLSTPNRFFEV